MRVIIISGLLCLGLVGCGSLPKQTVDTQSHAIDSVSHSQLFEHEPRLPVYLHDDICAILAERPHWREALVVGYHNWHVEPWYVMAFMYQESRFNPNALSSSRAYGYPQAKDDTWRWYQESRQRLQASRERFDDSVDFIGWYAHKNVDRNGIELNDVRNHYLAYHEGLGGFEKASFIGKPWLLTIADKVVDRASLYQAQLFSCPII